MQTIQVEQRHVLLSDQARKDYLAETLGFIKTNDALNLPKQLNDNDKHLITQTTSYQHANQAELNQMMDSILFVLHKQNYRVARGVYLKLMNACEWTQNYVAAYEIACFLYYRHHFIAIDVIHILLRYKNEIGHAKEALDMFELTYPLLPNHNDPLKNELLHIEYIKSLASLKRIDEALALCQAKIQALYNVSYHYGKMCFIYNNQPITPESVLWKEPGLQGFCLQLSVLLFRKYGHDSLHQAIAIGEFLYQVRPDFAKTVLALSGFYQKNKQIDKAKVCLINYLENYPDSVRVFVHYATLLIDNNEHEKAHDLSDAFINNYTKQRADLRKIKVLFAWFHEDVRAGQSLFKELIQEFPNHPMMVYLAIRYALKLRDDAWLDELMNYAKREFAANNELLELIACFSQARMICAAIESQGLTKSSHLLTDNQKPLLHTRACKVPDVVMQAFERFCSCEQKPCQSQCLDNVYLVGSGVTWCLDANNSDKSVNINQLNDLDFAMQMDDIPSEPIFAGFKRNNFILNLWTYKNPQVHDEPSIDLKLYRVKADKPDSPHDISAMMKDRDLTINMLALNSKGLVFDWTAGEGFAAYDGHYLKIHTDALTSLQHDPARVLRIVDKVVKHAYVLHPSLEKALHEFKLDSWFKNARLRDKFYKLLIHPSNNARLRFMQAYSLLGLDIDASGEVDEVLARCLMRFAITNQQPDLLKQKKTELTQQCEQQAHELRCIELSEEIEQLTTDIADNEAEYKKKRNSVDLLKKKTNQEVSTLFKAWQEEDLHNNSIEYKQLNEANQRLMVDIKASKSKEKLLYNAIKLTQVKSQLVSNWMSSITSLRYGSFFIDLLGKPVETACSISQSWDINYLKEMLGYSSNESFSAFIALYIGCSHLYSDENYNPLLAWYYLNQVKKILQCGADKSDKIQGFLNESLSSILDKAFQASCLESMTEIDLKTQLTNTTRPYDERDALAEHYLSHWAWSTSAINQALMIRAFERSDFNQFINLYDRAVKSNASIVNTRKFRQITDDLVIFFNKTCADDNLFQELTWFTCIKHSKALCMHAEVSKRLRAQNINHTSGITLDWYKFSRNPSVEAQSLMHMHLAELYLTLPHNPLENTLNRATAHYQQMKEVSVDDSQSGCFNLWAKLRLQWLADESNNVVRLSSKEVVDVLIPFFEQVVDTFKSTARSLIP